MTEMFLYDELSCLGSALLNEPLSAFTTFRTGGPAEILFEPAGEGELKAALGLINRAGVSLTVIGGGSNLLVSDEGIRGVVVRIASDGAAPVYSEGLVYADAGVSKENFIRFALDKGLGGVEFMAGVPGTVGGGIYMNAGTNMGSFSGILKNVRLLGPSGEISTVSAVDSISGYRSMALPEGSIILGGFFDLPRSADVPAVRKRVEEIIAGRWLKHPMEYPSAGSVFKNPEGHSSWKLINDSGLKGYSIGGAKVSEKHTNFIINTGSASSADIYRLVKHVQEKVYAGTGIMLETEIRLLGKFN